MAEVALPKDTVEVTTHDEGYSYPYHYPCPYPYPYPLSLPLAQTQQP